MEIPEQRASASRLGCLIFENEQERRRRPFPISLSKLQFRLHSRERKAWRVVANLARDSSGENERWTKKTTKLWVTLSKKGAETRANQQVGECRVRGESAQSANFSSPFNRLYCSSLFEFFSLTHSLAFIFFLSIALHGLAWTTVW